MTRIIIVCLFLLSVVSCTNTTPDKAASAPMAASVNSIVNVDDASVAKPKKAKCPCEGLAIEVGARGGHYCVRTSKTGTTYKAYLPKGETKCP
jgi:hypothetical protein